MKTTTPEPGEGARVTRTLAQLHASLGSRAADAILEEGVAWGDPRDMAELLEARADVNPVPAAEAERWSRGQSEGAWVGRPAHPYPGTRWDGPRYRVPASDHVWPVCPPNCYPSADHEATIMPDTNTRPPARCPVCQAMPGQEHGCTLGDRVAYQQRAEDARLVAYEIREGGQVFTDTGREAAARLVGFLVSDLDLGE